MSTKLLILTPMLNVRLVTPNFPECSGQESGQGQMTPAKTSPSCHKEDLEAKTSNNTQYIQEI